jgi:hypothetical protein
LVTLLLAPFLGRAVSLIPGPAQIALPLAVVGRARRHHGVEIAA